MNDRPEQNAPVAEKVSLKFQMAQAEIQPPVVDAQVPVPGPLALDKSPIDLTKIKQTIVPEVGKPVVLPADLQLSGIMVNGEDLIVKAANGDLIVIQGGLKATPSLVIGTVEIPAAALIASLQVGGVTLPAAGQASPGADAAQGPDNPTSSGGNFARGPGGIGDAFEFRDLLDFSERNRGTEKKEQFDGFVVKKAALVAPTIEIDSENNPLVVRDPTLAGGTEEDAAEDDTTDVVVNAGSGTVNSLVFDASLLNGIQVQGAAPGVNFTFSFDDPSTVAVENDPQTIYGYVTGTTVPVLMLEVQLDANVPPGTQGSGTVTATILDAFPHADGAGSATIIGVPVIAGDDQGQFSNLELGMLTVIDDVPLAADDTGYGVVEDGTSSVSGNVLDNDDSGADAPKSFVAWGSGDAAVIAALTTYGTLTQNPGGTWSYVLDNTRPATQALAPSFNQNYVLNYTMADADGDRDDATLTINLKGSDDGVSITGIGLVGGDEIVDEDDLPDGSSPVPGNLTQTGSFTITAPDGVDDLLIGGQSVVTDGVVTLPPAFATTYGMLTITSVNLTTGVVSYSYTLSDNTLAHGLANNGENDVFDTIDVTLTDLDGDSDSSDLIIKVIDDVPLAADDTGYGVVEDGTSSVSGNVLDNDDSGADAPKSFVAWGSGDAAVIAALTTYGTLTQNPGGTWSYVLDNTRPATQALAPTFNQNYVLNYTMADADGDRDDATLTINLQGSDDGVSITGIGLVGGDEIVDEDDLPDGSSPVPGNLTQTGSFTITAPDGVDDLLIGGQSVVTDGVVTLPPAFATTYGMLTITSVNLTTGVVSYSYTLSDNTLAHGLANNGENAVFDTIVVTLTDLDGDSDSSDLIIKVIDDVPLAADDGICCC